MTVPPPPILGPGDAHALPTWRAAYSDRTAAMMAAFSELAYLGPADPQLATSLSGGGFGAPQVFAVGSLQKPEHSSDSVLIRLLAPVSAYTCCSTTIAWNFKMENFP